MMSHQFGGHFCEQYISGSGRSKRGNLSRVAKAFYVRTLKYERYLRIKIYSAYFQITCKIAIKTEIQVIYKRCKNKQI